VLLAMAHASAKMDLQIIVLMLDINTYDGDRNVLAAALLAQHDTKNDVNRFKE
jgi:hypothetical protein